MWIFSDPVETKPVGVFLQLQFRSAVSVLQRVGGRGGESRCVEFADGRSQFTECQ